MVTPVIVNHYVSLAEYVKHHESRPTKVSERTVKRWLAAGELPGVYKNEHGAWMIPLDAYRTTPTEEPQALELHQPAATPVQYDPAPAPLSEIPAGRTFFSAAEASALMSCPEMHISEYAIRKNREYYHATVGENGQVAVPRYRILELKGLLPR